MKTKVILVVGLIVAFGNLTGVRAQVKQVQMHIAGYLCGN
jgi:hypothetical protein